MRKSNNQIFFKMEDLVHIDNEKAITTSLKVAEIFNKRHDSVLRDIENLRIDLQNINQKDLHNFGEISYKDKYGRSQKAYQMNKDGFTLLAMGGIQVKKPLGLSWHILKLSIKWNPKSVKCKKPPLTMMNWHWCLI